MLTRVRLETPEWRGLLDRAPSAGPFHHPGWAGVLSRAYGFEAFGLALQRADGRVVAGVPCLNVGRKRWVSMPFTDYCPVLGDGRELAAGLQGLRSAEALRSLEVRDEVPGGVSVQVGVRHQVDLSGGTAQTHQAFHKTRVRATLRRAERELVTATVVGSDDDSLETFYRLHTATRRRLGTAVQPKAFFRELWFALEELGYVVVAKDRGRAVAAAVFLAWKDQAVYKFSASDRSRPETGAGNAVLWAGMQHATSLGCTRMDLGRTETSHEGLLQFKRGWGGEEIPLIYTEFGEAPKSRGGNSQRLVGPFIRHSPPVVTRMVGRLAYRRTA